MRYSLIILSLLILTSCSSGSKPPASPSLSTSSDPPLDPNQPKIQAIEIIKGGGFPLQYSAAITVNLAGQCKKISEITQAFENPTFKIDILTEDQATCATPLETVEQIIPLDMLNLTAGVYKIVVNGFNKEFELPTDNKI